MTVGAFEYVAISVGDIERQTQFYRDFLELDTVEVGLESAEVRTAILSGSGMFKLELIAREGSEATAPASPMERALRRGLNHLALRVPNLESACASAVRAGGEIVVGPRDAQRPGLRFAFVRDPEGNLLELAAASLA